MPYKAWELCVPCEPSSQFGRRCGDESEGLQKSVSWLSGSHNFAVIRQEPCYADPSCNRFKGIMADDRSQAADQRPTVSYAEFQAMPAMQKAALLCSVQTAGSQLGGDDPGIFIQWNQHALRQAQSQPGAPFVDTLGVVDPRTSAHLENVSPVCCPIL